MRAKRERDLADGVLPPMTGKVAGKVIDSDSWFRYFGAIGSVRSEGGGGDLFPERDPIVFRRLTLDPQKIVDQLLIKGSSLRRVKRA